MNQSDAIANKNSEIAGRIRELREIAGWTAEEVARKADVTKEEYLACEAGGQDMSFAFLYRCASAFGVDVTDLISGNSPKLQRYALTRAGGGQRIEDAHGMTYYSLAASFRKKTSVPLYVRAAYSEAAQIRPIELTTHVGQELDIVIRGKLRVQVGNHVETLSEGDTIYYDSATPHGMIAVGGEDCLFYAIVLSPTALEEQDGATEEIVGKRLEPEKDETQKAEMPPRIWQKYIETEENAEGMPLSLRFHDTDHFNFAYDIVDVLGERKPDKTAMVWVGEDGSERRFTFAEIRRASSQCANYFKSLGIRRGDRVMLVLKRHYQFWFALLGLHKLGAVAIPGTHQLLAHDFVYRFQFAGIRAVLCTADDDTAEQIELAAKECPELACKMMVDVSGKPVTRPGWRDFNAEYGLFSGRFQPDMPRPGGSDDMLMFFTSGTTGYPKLAVHDYRYPLGHFMTAKYWHRVDPDGLHLTVADTGWAKALWGKLYGQWLCEAAVFVYDFSRFHAADLIPMFAKYHITTFCAPATIYRMMIKEDLSQYDFSSLKHASMAGEALNPEVFRQFEKATGLRIMEGFGQSESPLMLGNLAGMPHVIGSMGKPVPTFPIDLITPEGTVPKMGDVGEIVVHATPENRPFGLMREYYHDAEKTADIWSGGVYHTGDLAWRDEDGYFWYVGRADDVIKSSGYRIGPFEIESTLMELPYILECGVSAAPDELRGQVVKASIVLTQGTQPSEALKKEIQDYVKHRTAPYKYPRIVVFCDSLPKTTSGKIQRNKL